MNISAINNATATPKFTGFTETVGSGYEKILKSDAFKKVMNSDIMQSDKIGVHLTTASSALTSGMYVYKNLTDKRKTKNERITSAINNALTFAIGTALSYTVTGLLKGAIGKAAGNYFDKQIGGKDGLLKKITDHVAANPGCTELPKNLASELKEKQTTKKGMSTAIDLVTCTAINRFFVPVFITPIANKLGDKLCKFLDKRDAEKAAKAQEQNLNKQA